jgi:ribosomal protein S18 acetylase RimI-like enzyme
MPAEIRDARPEDAPAIGKLLATLGYEPRADLDSTLATWLADPANRLLVADLDGEVAGVLALHSWPHLARAGSRARITALAVAEPARRQGLARRLVEAAERVATELGCVEMEVTSRLHRTEAQAFYRALGYEEVSGRSARFMRELS